MTDIINNNLLLPLAIAIPALSALFILVLPRDAKDIAKTFAYLGFGLPLILSCFLFSQFDLENANAFQFAYVVNTGLEAFGINLHLGLNGVSLPLFMLASIVGFCAGMYAIHSKAENLKDYLVLLLIMHAGLIGTFISVDIFFYFLFHEIALIPTFILIGYWGGQGSRSAAIEMAIYLTLGAMLTLVGFIALSYSSGLPEPSFNFEVLRDHFATNPLSNDIQSNIFGLLLIGLGILVALYPFHTWAPRSYAAAPTPVAMLHAGVLKKFGLYGLVQIVVPLIPEGLLSGWGCLLGWLAVANILIVGFITMSQKDLKQMLGYSSVMHMGYCFLGILAFSKLGAGGAIILMFGHGLTVALLFLLSTMIYHRSETFDMKEMGGLASKTPILAGCFVAAIFASIGLPGFASFWGEFTIFVSLWAKFPIFCMCAVAGIVISAVYGLRAVADIFYGTPTDSFKKRFESNEVKDLNFLERVPVFVLLLSLMAVGFYPKLISVPVNNGLDSSYASTVQVSRCSKASVKSCSVPFISSFCSVEASPQPCSASNSCPLVKRDSCESCSSKDKEVVSGKK